MVLSDRTDFSRWGMFRLEVVSSRIENQVTTPLIVSGRGVVFTTAWRRREKLLFRIPPILPCIIPRFWRIVFVVACLSILCSCMLIVVCVLLYVCYTLFIPTQEKPQLISTLRKRSPTPSSTGISLCACCVTSLARSNDVQNRVRFGLSLLPCGIFYACFCEEVITCNSVIRKGILRSLLEAQVPSPPPPLTYCLFLVTFLCVYSAC